MKKLLTTLLIFILAICTVWFSACSNVSIKLSFIVDGQVYATVATNGQETVTIPQDPVKDGYNFDGWFWDDGVWEKPFTANSLLDAPITADMKVYAKFSLPHEHSYVETTVNPTCTEKGYIKRACECGEISEIVYNADELGHDFGEYVSDGNATYEADGTQTRRCKREGCEGKETITEANSMLIAKKLEFDTLSVIKVNNKAYTVYGKQPNGTASFDFEDEITPSEGATYKVYTDANGQNEVNKAVVLNTGDNKFYLHMDNNGNTVVYTVTLRVRPKYTVSFKNYNGSSFTEKQVEEDALVTAPSTSPMLEGYDFGGWDFDFTTPITGDTTITAKAWTASTFNVTFNGNGGTTPDIKQVTYLEEYGELPNATKFGYGLTGWYTEASGGDKIESDDVFELTSNITLYAHWRCDFTYELNYNSTAYLVSSVNRDGDLQVLSSYEGKNVTGFSTYFNANNPYYRATSIDMSYNTYITAIKDSNFEGAFTLKSIKLPPNLTTIENEAFNGCSNLESITLPNTVESIGEYAFYNCKKLTSITMADNVKTIGMGAFWSCWGLTNVTIGKGVTSIGKHAFYDCKALNQIKFNATAMSDVSSSDANIFVSAGYETDGIEVTIGANVTKISTYLFFTYEDRGISYKENMIKSVTFETNSVCESIGQYAFSKTKLENVQIPSSVKTIGSQAFYGCIALETVTFGDNSQLQSLGTEIFKDCTALKGNEINNGLYLGSSGQPCLILIKIKDTTCENFEIKADTKFVLSDAFKGCASLQSITVATGNANYSSQDGILYNGDKTEFVLVPTAINGTVTIPNTIASLGSYFVGRSSLEGISIPSSITSISADAFNNCTSLKSITVDSSNTNYSSQGGILYDKGVTQIVFVPKAISGSVIVPNTIKSIGLGAFSGCSLLQSISLPFIGATLNGTSNTHFGYIFGASAYDDNNSCVPTSLKTVIVTGGKGIDSYAFYNCSNIESVQLPDGVLNIYLAAFQKCSSLKSVNLPSGLASIGQYAFSETKLENVQIPSSVTIIDDYAFKDCKRLSALTFGENSLLENIGNQAFYNCTLLQSVEIPSAVTSIEGYAFYNCVSLTQLKYNAIQCADFSSRNGVFYNAGKDGSGITVTFGASVKKIPANMFYPDNNSSYYPKLLAVKFEAVGNIESIGECAFISCSSFTGVYINDIEAWFSMDFTYTSNPLNYAKNLYLNNELVTNLVVPNTVESIGQYAFKGCTSIVSLTFEGGSVIESIGKDAFSNCSNLNNLYVSDLDVLLNITSGMDELSSIDNLYVNGELLTELVVPNTATEIPNFPGFGNIKTIVFETGSLIDSIPKNGFANCANLESITIPSSVITIGEYAFYNCSKLKTIAFETGSELESIGGEAFYNCVALERISIPSNVTTIGVYAFRDCDNLASVEFSNSVKSIGSSAFYGCDKLKTVNYIGTADEWASIKFVSTNSNPLYNSGNLYLNGELVITITLTVENINAYAFYYCNSLENVTIANGVQVIGYMAFTGCNSLKNITISNSVTSIGGSAFSLWGVQSLKVNFLGTANEWASINFEDSSSNPVIIAGDLYLNDEVLTEANLSMENVPAYIFQNCRSLQTVTFADNLNEIGENAFYNCTSLQSIEIPDSVTSIGNNAFHNCPIATAKIPALAISSIANGYLNTLIITSDTSIPDNAFDECYTLENVTIADSVQSIGEKAFYGRECLKTVTFGDNSQLESIGASAFENCRELQNIEIPSRVKSIGEKAFSACVKLSTVTFETGSQLESIGGYTFTYCTSLESITVPISVTDIGECVFYLCSKIKDIYYDGTIEAWNDIDKATNWNFIYEGYNSSFTVHCSNGTITIS